MCELDNYVFENRHLSEWTNGISHLEHQNNISHTCVKIVVYITGSKKVGKSYCFRNKTD